MTLMIVQSPPSFMIRTEAEKAASDNGFRISTGTNAGWIGFRSTTAQGQLWITGGSDHGPWLLALDHEGVIAELQQPRENLAGPGSVRFSFEGLGGLYAILPRIYQLSASLPNAPLRAFQIQIAQLPRTTEAERRVVQRIGQDIFRASLMEYWQGQCPLTGITDPALLRASHIIPWADCESDAERLNVHNGLLLSALWDAAFDRALVTFNDAGMPEFSPDLSDAARTELRWRSPVPLTDEHRKRLVHHQVRMRATPSPLPG